MPLLDVTTHLFAMKRTAFVLWRPRHSDAPPKLVIGQFAPGNPPALAGRVDLELEPRADHRDLWRIEVIRCA